MWQEWHFQSVQFSLNKYRDEGGANLPLREFPQLVKFAPRALGHFVHRIFSQSSISERTSSYVERVSIWELIIDTSRADSSRVHNPLATFPAKYLRKLRKMSLSVGSSSWEIFTTEISYWEFRSPLKTFSPTLDGRFRCGKLNCSWRKNVPPESAKIYQLSSRI